jgi:bisphosphoglycerate-dependent phosphoglycerate mutase
MLILVLSLLFVLFSLKKRTRKTLYKVIGICMKLPLYFVVKLPFRILAYFWKGWRRKRLIQKRADEKVELQRRKIEARLNALQADRDKKKAAAQKAAAVAQQQQQPQS